LIYFKANLKQLALFSLMCCILRIKIYAQYILSKKPLQGLAIPQTL